MQLPSHHHRPDRGLLIANALIASALIANALRRTERKINVRLFLMEMIVVGCINLIGTSMCSAAIVGFLTEPRKISGERFESDLFLAGDAERIGDEIELINLDVFHSRINSQQLTDYGRVRFDSASGLAPWQQGQQFGLTPGFESVIILDAFAGAAALPYPITNTDPFLVGTFTFDYGGLGLGVGDRITLDLSGRDDGSSSKTTSIAIRSNGPSGSSTTVLIDPNFSTTLGSETSVFQIATAIPEPGAPAVLCLIAVGFFSHRRRRESLRRIG